MMRAYLIDVLQTVLVAAGFVVVVVLLLMARSVVTTARLRRHAEDPDMFKLPLCPRCGAPVGATGACFHRRGCHGPLRRHEQQTAALTCDRCGGPLDRNGVCVFEYLASRGDGAPTLTLWPSPANCTHCGAPYSPTGMCIHRRGCDSLK